MDYKKLFPYESTQLADHNIGVFWNFLEVIIRENSQKTGTECKHRTILCLSQFQYQKV